MGRDEIVESLVSEFKAAVGSVLSAESPDVAAASLSVHAALREVGRQLLQAKVSLDAERRHGDKVSCDCGCAGRYVHTRLVHPITLFGPIDVPVRTHECLHCGATLRADDEPLGLPAAGRFLDDVASFYSALVAELPVRVGNEAFLDHFGVKLSNLGAQGIVDRAAEDVREWRCGREAEESKVVADEIAAGRDASSLRLEVAVDGVMAHIDGAWHEVKVGAVVVRRLPAREETEVPALGDIVARRYCAVFGTREDLAPSLRQLILEAGWHSIPIAQVLGDGSEWIWNMADDEFPGVPQVLDWYHLSQHLYEFARIRYADGDLAKAWVHVKRDILREGRVGDVLSALKRTVPANVAEREALEGLIGYVENNRRRIDYSAPWSTGLAVGSGSVEGACKHLIQTRFKRAGMRWKRAGFLNVLELRLAKLNGTLREFWASRFEAVTRQRARSA